MVSDSEGEVVNLLQDLGLREYEAKCFAALTRLPTGTAKRISETTAVPRTRVYEAVRVLESSGLVDVQQGNPQQYWAVEVDEAVGIHEARSTTTDPSSDLVDRIRKRSDDTTSRRDGDR